MGAKIAIAVVVYVIATVGFSFCFWDWFSRGEPSVSAIIRNLLLSWGAPLATGLAVWRSMVAQLQSEAAQKQAEIAQRGLLSNRYQRAVEMLGNDLGSIRIGGIHALVNLAREHPDEYQREVVQLLCVYELGVSPSPEGEQIQATLEDAFVAILGEEEGGALVQQSWQRRARNFLQKQK